MDSERAWIKTSSSRRDAAVLQEPQESSREVEEPKDDAERNRRDRGLAWSGPVALTLTKSLAALLAPFRSACTLRTGPQGCHVSVTCALSSRKGEQDGDSRRWKTGKDRVKVAAPLDENYGGRRLRPATFLRPLPPPRIELAPRLEARSASRILTRNAGIAKTRFHNRRVAELLAHVRSPGDFTVSTINYSKGLSVG